MTDMKIVTHFWAKHIPTSPDDDRGMSDRSHDWAACRFDDYSPDAPTGYGKTEAEAIANLRRLLSAQTDA
jgi:uncharacterized hydantoinase/oxoprolinase family protein